uniref:Uncharacterized protein n=1 Tax=Pectobacterium phage Pappous TaxID=3158140 RepID=A0AB39ABV5_9CAUD
MNIVEMEGFLLGKCIPRDMLVNESSAAYLVRKFSELEIQRDALIAENVRLKSAIREINNSSEEAEIDGYLTFTVNPDFIHSAVDLIDGEIPATDDAVRELMARGVDEFSSSIGAEYSKLKPSSITAKAIKATVLRDTKFAQRLREGGV